jgi:hypothetical protein
MNAPSDLDLVAEATRSTDDASVSIPVVIPCCTASAPPSSLPAHQSIDKLKPTPTGVIDVDSLTPDEIAILEPLITSLVPDSGESECEVDDLRIMELLNRLDVAGEVADEIEGKLDRLLDSLGQAEKEMQEGLDAEVRTGISKDSARSQ